MNAALHSLPMKAAEQPISSAKSTHDKESQLTLELLSAIEQKDDVSQRVLAQKMGVALGLANSYLKRCIKKGWVKVSTAPANRYAYYLTPTGFSEKARLTADFFTTSFALFRQAGEQYTRILTQHIESEKDKSSRLLIVGLSDLTEIALMRALQLKLQVVGVYQPNADREELFGYPVLQKFPEPADFDVIVITSLEQTASLLEECEQCLPSSTVLVPPMLLSMKYRGEQP